MYIYTHTYIHTYMHVHKCTYIEAKSVRDTLNQFTVVGTVGCPLWSLSLPLYHLLLLGWARWTSLKWIEYCRNNGISLPELGWKRLLLCCVCMCVIFSLCARLSLLDSSSPGGKPAPSWAAALLGDPSAEALRPANNRVSNLLRGPWGRDSGHQ